MTNKLDEFALPLTSLMAIARPQPSAAQGEICDDDMISFSASTQSVEEPQSAETCVTTVQPTPEPECFVSIMADKIATGGSNNGSCQTFDITFNVYCSSPTGAAYESECYTIVKRITVDKRKMLEQARQQASQVATMLENKKLREAVETKKRFRVLAGLE